MPRHRCRPFLVICSVASLTFWVLPIAKAEPSIETSVGTITSCAWTEDFQSFYKSIARTFLSQYYETDPHSGFKPEPVIVPPGLSVRLDRIDTKTEDGVTLMTIPASGSLRGLKLKQIEYTFGHEAGLSIIEFVFDESRDRLIELLESDLKRGQLFLLTDPVGTTVNFGEDRASIWCDQST